MAGPLRCNSLLAHSLCTIYSAARRSWDSCDPLPSQAQKRVRSWGVLPQHLPHSSSPPVLTAQSSPTLNSKQTETDFHSPGVKSYDVSLDTQTATVVTDSSLSYDKVLATIAKTGKKVNTGEADGEVKSVEVVAA